MEISALVKGMKKEDIPKIIQVSNNQQNKQTTQWHWRKIEKKNMSVDTAIGKTCRMDENSYNAYEYEEREHVKYQQGQ